MSTRGQPRYAGTRARATRIPLVGGAALAAATLAGCISSTDKLGVGAEDMTINAVSPADDAPSLPQRREMGSTEPEPIPLDRSGWERTALRVPPDSIKHFPTHRTDWHLARAHRERGGYPDALSALESPDFPVLARFHEGGAVALGALTDFAFLPFRFIWTEPHWEPTRARSHGYERSRATPWIAGVVSSSPAGPAADPPDDALPTDLRRPAPPEPDAEGDEGDRDQPASDAASDAKPDQSGGDDDGSASAGSGDARPSGDAAERESGEGSS